MDMVGIPDWKMNFQCGKSADREFFHIASTETENEIKKRNENRLRRRCGNLDHDWDKTNRTGIQFEKAEIPELRNFFCAKFQKSLS